MPFGRSKKLAKHSALSITDQKAMRKQVDELRRIESHSFRQRHGRTDFYEYLEAVLQVYSGWKKKGKGVGLRDYLMSVYNLASRKGKFALHYLVEASSKQGEKVRNRWVQALRYASGKRAAVKKLEFVKFLQENGGIVGCAGKMAQISARTKKNAPKKSLRKIFLAL